MPKEVLEKKTLNLRAGDWNKLEAVFGPKDIPVSLVIRKLVSRLVAKHYGEPTETDVDKINLEVDLDG